MERGGTGGASNVRATCASRAEIALLSGVARGSEREGGNTRARGGQRPDRAAPARRHATRRREVSTHAGPSPGDFRFCDGFARASRVVQCRRPAASFRKPLIYSGSQALPWAGYEDRLNQLLARTRKLA